MKAMLAKDLSDIWYNSLRLRQQVKQNNERFPEHFMFQLSDIEVDPLVSQNVMPSQSFGGAVPYALG